MRLTTRRSALLFDSIQSLLETLRSSPPLTIAAIQGPAIGAGADLALACDLRIGTPSAAMRFPGPQFGVVLGTRRLAEIVGTDRALLSAFTNRTVPADRALRWGLLTVVLGDEEDLDRVVTEVANQAAAVDVGTAAILLDQVRGGGGSEREALRGSLEPSGLAARIRALGSQPPREESK